MSECNKEKKLIKIGTEFLDYALNNQQYKGCDKVGQNCHVQCGICQKIAKNAHPLCYQHYLKKNDDVLLLMWRSEYPIGCSHENWDGESWCNGCWTIVNDKPTCFNCIECNWGTLNNNEKNKNYNFMWVDKTESSINDLLKLRNLTQKYKIEK
jgi:hypothetical protein